MKTGKSIVELAQELARRSGTKIDMVAATDSLYVEPEAKNITVRAATERTFPMTDLFASQAAGWAGIPAVYAEQMRAKAPALLAVNLNEWFRNEATVARRMIRVLDDNARAFLSDRYRRIDNEDVAEAVLPVLLESPEIRVVSCDVTDRRLYLKALFPKVEAEIKVGDAVQAGVMITNSEVGLGALSVQPLVYRLACSNGMVSQDAGISRYHVGRKVDGDGARVHELFRDETLAADDHALMLKLQDVVRAASSEASFGVLVDKMREATIGPHVQKPVAAVEILAKSVGLLEAEKGSVLENLIRGQDYSRWGMLNAVTAVANEHASYDRATELESLGGRILNLPAADWMRVAEAA